MITVVLPTLDAERHLPATLAALMPAVVGGLVREVIIADGGSSDGTADIAEATGATFCQAPRGRGQQMAVGAARARCRWLLFLHADTSLEPGWEQEVTALVQRVDSGERPETAAAFCFALDDTGFKPRLLESLVRLRCTLFRLPYGDQGLLVPVSLYRKLGGHAPLPLMEDVDIVRRLGRRRIVMLRSRAVTSAMRYKRDGYALRSLRNLSCLALYYLRVPPRYITRLYG